MQVLHECHCSAGPLQKVLQSKVKGLGTMTAPGGKPSSSGSDMESVTDKSTELLPVGVGGGMKPG